MTSFIDMKRGYMAVFTEKVMPFLRDGRPGHLWTARLELAGIIVGIEDWIQANTGDLLERGEALELLNYFKSLPNAKYTHEECTAALAAETRKWTHREKGSKR